MLSHTTTIEDLHGHTLKIAIQYAICPAEREVRYYPDGSGQPGSPTYIEDFSVTLLEIDEEDVSHYGPGTIHSFHEMAVEWVSHEIDNDGALAGALWENANDDEPFEDYPWDF